MLTVCVSASDPDLTTTGPVMLEIFGATTTDQVASTYEIQRLSTLIRRASQWAEQYARRPLLLQTYSETLGSPGDNLLMLSARPVVSVQRFFDSTATSGATVICSSEFRVESKEAGFIGRDIGFLWSAQVAARQTAFSLGLVDAVLPGRETRPWLVEYTAGWTLGGITTGDANWSTAGPAGSTTTGRTLPQDVELAVIYKVREWWRGASRTVRSERVGDLAVEHFDPISVLGPAEELLAPYRSAI